MSKEKGSEGGAGGKERFSIRKRNAFPATEFPGLSPYGDHNYMRFREIKFSVRHPSPFFLKTRRRRRRGRGKRGE